MRHRPGIWISLVLIVLCSQVVVARAAEPSTGDPLHAADPAVLRIVDFVFTGALMVSLIVPGISVRFDATRDRDRTRLRHRGAIRRLGSPEHMIGPG
jgi:hypothetical protein